MSLRLTVSTGALSFIALFVGTSALMRGQALKTGGPESNTASKSGKAWTAPRTPGGHPDFQGYWTNATYTPLERPEALGTKEFYTEAEELELVKRLRLQDNSQPKDDIHYDNRTWQDESYSKGISNHRTSLIFDPPDGRIPPLNAKGQQRAVEFAHGELRRKAAVSAKSMSLAERCITWGTEGPPMIGSTYNANFQILENDTSVAIVHEMIHSARMIPFDGRPHLPEDVRQLGGDSRGRWEGDTLVVETANFTDKTNFRGPPAHTRQDIFSSNEMHVVERFTRIDAETIVYRFTVEDPGTWTKPWSGEVVLKRFEGPMFEYACHEGNYGLANILAGARAKEKAAETTSLKPAP
jgi:hypothetical protein